MKRVLHPVQGRLHLLAYVLQSLDRHLLLRIVQDAAFAFRGLLKGVERGAAIPQKFPLVQHRPARNHERKQHAGDSGGYPRFQYGHP